MFGPYPSIGRRNNLSTSALACAVCILLPAAAAQAGPAAPPVGGVDLSAQGISVSNSGAMSAQAPVTGAAAAASASGDPSIRPFQFHASDEDLADLRRRI